jgi:hypothetical protein
MATTASARATSRLNHGTPMMWPTPAARASWSVTAGSR